MSVVMTCQKIFLKKFEKTLADYENSSNFAAQKTKNGPLAQLNRAFDYGSKGYRFESCRDHFYKSQVLENEALATFIYHFAPHLPHQIIKETHKRESAIRHF